MKPYFRRTTIGIFAGALSSPALTYAIRNPVLALLCGIFLGALYAASLRSARSAYAENLMTGAALGIPLWGLISVVAIPVSAGQMPEWNAEGMRAHLPALVAWVLYGALFGLIYQAFSDLAAARWGQEAKASVPVPSPLTRVVILGGGFAGMKTAQCLEKEFEKNISVHITLVSETNALLFTPMLAEVAGSSLEPSHISTPLRTSLRRTQVIRGRVSKVDLEGRRIQVTVEGGGVRELVYDQVVFALGAVSNYLGLKNVEELAFDFKSLLDAIRIRNHVIDMFEQADRETDPELRREKLTFVIAGGGFAGVELAGALNDFSRGILADYPNIDSEDLQIILVHARDRILPELSESLARYAQESMAMRGVTFRLNCRLHDCRPGR